MPSAAANDLKQRQADFLNRIRAADPDHHTIDRAMLNEQNELGLILDRTVEMDKVPELMRTILGQMAREFPGQDLTVLAYAPSNPPHKIGTARLHPSNWTRPPFAMDMGTLRLSFPSSCFSYTFRR